MITNHGKQLVAKFLLNQAPAYASYIAAGVGSKPLSTSASVSISPEIKSLDFEAFRVPISSKGFIKEDGLEKIVFKAEMPSEQRYQITELGVYPAINNSVAGRYDSKLLVTFSPTEQWQYFISGNASAIPYPNEALDDDNASSNLNADIQDVLFINSESTVFNNIARKNRQEPPRFLNRSLMVSGSTSFLDALFEPSEGSLSIENPLLSFDLGNNLPEDQIKLALSVVSRNATTNTNPDSIRILVEFINNIPGLTTTAPKARLKITLSDADLRDSQGNVNRYIVINKFLSQFIKDNTFSWANVNYIRIYTSVLVSDEPSDDYFIVYDGIRLENLTSQNPLYTLFAYNVIQTEDGYPIIKQENTSNYIEYRYVIGVDG